MSEGQLQLAGDALEQLSDHQLLSDAYDAAAILSMGSDEGLSAFTAVRLRGDLVAAVRELALRWGL